MTEAASGPAVAGVGEPASGATAATRAGRLGRIGWILYDAGGSPYWTLINVFLFSAYFTSTVVGDPVEGAKKWALVSAAASLVLVLGGPIAGAIADAGGRRKPWLAACTLLGAPCMAGLWFATPMIGDGLPLVIACLLGSFIAFEFSQIFASAMLANVAPKAKVGLYSGLGYAVGNLTAVALLLFYLVAWEWSPTPWFGLDKAASEPLRAVGPMVGLIFLLYAIPLFLFTPDTPSTNLPAGRAVREGLRRLGETLVKVRQYGNVVTYLVARIIFNEGFVAVMMFTGMFAGAVLHWSPYELALQGVMNSVIAGFSGVFAGWLTDRIGPKKATLIFLVGVLAANTILLSITPVSAFFIHFGAVDGPGLYASLPDKIFLANGIIGAVCVIGGYVSTRTLMIKLSPPAMLNEFFGLFYLSGRAASFLGPLMISIVIGSFRSIHAGVVVGVIFTLIGLIVMLFVREPREQTALQAGGGPD
jgi:UMF1 family MFS transporter